VVSGGFAAQVHTVAGLHTAQDAPGRAGGGAGLLACGASRNLRHTHLPTDGGGRRPLRNGRRTCGGSARVEGVLYVVRGRAARFRPLSRLAVVISMGPSSEVAAVRRRRLVRRIVRPGVVARPESRHARLLGNAPAAQVAATAETRCQCFHYHEDSPIPTPRGPDDSRPSAGSAEPGV